MYETPGKTDRKYNAAGALLESDKHFYKYDEEGNLISKVDKLTQKKTKYEWQGNGMLTKVIKPDAKEVAFKYDALGGRTEKLSPPDSGRPGEVVNFHYALFCIFFALAFYLLHFSSSLRAVKLLL